MGLYSDTVKAYSKTFNLTKIAPIAIGKIKSLDYGKIFYASVSSEEYDGGCYFAPFKSNGTNTSVIELGELEISDPQVIKGFKISAAGDVNDNWALAIGQNSPEQIIYQIPNSLINKNFNINTETSNTINLKKFKLYIIVHQQYRILTAEQFLERANNSPMETVSVVQNAMSSECKANDATAVHFTDGFYANYFNVEMIFN